MRKNMFLKTIVVILLAFSLFALASCVTSSTRMQYDEWEFSEDGELLCRTGIDGERTTYTLVGLEYNVAITGDVYAYMSSIDSSLGEYLTCYAPSEDSRIVFLSEYYGIDSRSTVYIYAEEGSDEAAAYADFLAGGSERHTAYLIGRGKEGVFSEAELSALYAEPTDETLSVALEVKSLRGKAACEILAYSPDRRLARVEGAIYEVSGEQYYVDYTALDNSYFDADGNFSYQRGTVVAERLTGEKKTTVEAVMHRTVYVNESVSLEEGRYIEKEESTTAQQGALMLVIMTVIVGLCIPLLPIGYVLMYALTEKKRDRTLARPTRGVPTSLWVMLSGGVLWFVAALVLIIIFGTV